MIMSAMELFSDTFDQFALFSLQKDWRDCKFALLMHFLLADIL